MNPFESDFLSAGAVLDQELADFRSVYEQWAPTKKKAVCEWLAEIVRLTGDHARFAPLDVRVVLHLEATDEDGEITSTMYTNRSPQILLRALESWKRGDGFTPTNPFV